MLEGIDKHYKYAAGSMQMTYIGTVIYTMADQALRSAGIDYGYYRPWLIIDGQQRLTTITLLAMSLAQHLASVQSGTIEGLLQKDPGNIPLKTLDSTVEEVVKKLIHVAKVGRGDDTIPRVLKLALQRFHNRFQFLVSISYSFRSRLLLE